MPDYGHEAAHETIAQTLNTYHGTSLSTTIDSTPVSWSVGWVHPTSGNDAYNGETPQTPKATISAAITAGFRTIHVAAGTHTVSSINSNAALIFHPGVHTFSNAPVTSTTGLTLIGYAPPPQKTDTTEGSAIIQGSGTSTDIFSFSNGTSQRWAVTARWLKFDASTFTRSAIYSVDLNMADIDENVIYTSANWEANTYLYYSVQTLNPPVVDSSWSRITRNTCIGAALCYVDQGYDWVNRYNISGNRGYSRSGSNATNPFISLTGRHTGHSITDNSFEGMDSTVADAAIYMDGPATALYIAGNGFERIDNTSGLAIKLGAAAGDIANSIIHFSAGHTTASGALQVNGTTYSGATTGVYTDTTYKNQILVAGRYNNV